jgi:uncharacterized protein (DUF697 family)
MEEKLTEGKILQILNYAYEKSLNGIAGTDSAVELANYYLSKHENAKEAADSLVTWQVAKCATTGFVTGFGGILTMPVTVPANIGVVLYVQMRMIAAIAHIGGYNIYDDQVKSLIYLCMVGKKASDIAKVSGIIIGKKIAQNSVKKHITKPVIKKINQAVGFRLVTKFGQTAPINLGKTVPIIGGAIGAIFDGITTKTIGKIAIKLFIA